MMGLIHRTTMDGYGNKNCVTQLGSCEQNGKKAPCSLTRHPCKYDITEMGVPKW